MKFLRIGFWALVILNFAIRGWLVLDLNTQPVSDFVRYYQAAIDLTLGKGYMMFGRTTAFQGVGYPGFLAIFFSIFGPSVLLAKILNWCLSLGSGLLLLFIAKRILPEKAAMLATLIYLYLPKEIFYVNVLGSELLFNTLLLAFFSCYVLSWPKSGKQDGRNWMWLIPVGIILGVMSLVKPTSPVFGLIIFIGEIGRYMAPAWFGSREVRGGISKGIVRTGIVAMLSILVIAPWSYRNYVVFDAFIPLTTNSGYVLYINNNPDAKGTWMDPYKIPNSPILDIPYPETDPRFEVAMTQSMKEAAWTWIKDNPKRFMELMLYRFYETFYRNWDWSWAFQGHHPGVTEQMKEVILRIAVLTHAMVASAFFIGVIPVLVGTLTRARSFWKRKGPPLSQWEPRLLLFLFSLPACVITLVTMIFEGNARYSFPCHPMFALYTALLVSVLWKAARDMDLLKEEEGG